MAAFATVAKAFLNRTAARLAAATTLIQRVEAGVTVYTFGCQLLQSLFLSQLLGSQFLASSEQMAGVYAEAHSPLIGEEVVIAAGSLTAENRHKLLRQLVILGRSLGL